MFKARLTIVPLALLMSLSGQVQAITERETFEVSVSIPTAEFYVIPSEPDWIHQEQALSWNSVSGELAPLRKTFDVKNTNGAISARISAEPYLSNGRDSDNIALKVMFNRKQLTVDAAEVVPDVDARAGKRVSLDIAAIQSSEGYQPGSYFGSVHMIFEALAP